MAREKKLSGFSLKDQLFNRERVAYLAGLFSNANPEFAYKDFIRETMRKLTTLELKERIVHIAKTLEKYLAEDFKTATSQIVRSLPPPLDPTKTDDDFGDFIFAPLGEFVVRNGMARRHWRVSLNTLKEITQRFSMEDAIRFFINEHPEQTLNELGKWVAHKNYHVRRLVSEGTRPMLPWSKRLSLDPTIPVPLLDSLHADSTRYVTRSVANHLNDISKTNPSLVLETLEKWAQAKMQRPAELGWITRHSLRTLVKQGNREALCLLGFQPNPGITINDFRLKSNKVRRGDTIEFSFSIKSTREERLMVDYLIDFVKANGRRAKKVHKLKQLETTKGESIELSKRHKLHANATTYTLYPGLHRLTLQINGKSFGALDFELE